MIAEVIVDVAAYPIDRPFDYAVPAEWEAVMEPGLRVKVPFGPRKVVGYVTGIKMDSELDSAKIKSIIEIIDLEPVLSPELLQLSRWMADETIAYEIDALQVMLPAAMRAKYEKIMRVIKPELLDEHFLEFLGKRRQVTLKALQDAHLLNEAKKYSEAGAVQIDTAVQQKTKIKKVRMIHIPDADHLQSALADTHANAKKQIELINWLLEHPSSSLEASEIMNKTGVKANVLKALLDKKVVEESQVEVYRELDAPKMRDSGKPEQLTDEQQVSLTAIEQASDQEKQETFLLHGITGSGKTEVYLQAIDHVLKKGKEAIVLVPEISLTPQMTARFKARFGELVAVLHSGLSSGEKYDEWRRIHRGEVKVAIGARSAVFAPFTNLGLLILDEEHESTYKQEESPRYHARDVAIWRGDYYQCPVILGSATPSLESYARATKGVYTLLTLTKRAKQQALPSVQVVDMREELKAGNRSMFSLALADAIRERLERKEQIVLLLNKRGFSSFVLCRDCGTVVECPNCDISLTYHRSSESLKCHYCGHEQPVPLECPECESEHIRFFGTGTQKAQEELYKLVPEARVIRMDVDTTGTKGAHERLLHDFGEGKADILLGTQMIAKGLDFPRITLVGVLAADTSLHLADFRAAEKTFQLLTQVSGRAGRDQLPGEVVIQTYDPEHYAIELSKSQLYVPFYDMEMERRRQLGYPPYYYVTVVQFSHEDVLKAADYAHKGTAFLAERLSAGSVIIGPTAAAISRLNNRYRYQCLVKYKQEPALIPVLQELLKHYKTNWVKDGLIMSINREPTAIF
ncbi:MULTISPECIES: primosomal protein N' [Sporosarcina]|uniref:primosomal protein N' n=1 Tax=Sporosarcina TaxID=1569 RepID=UPI00129A5695|nr:MULTISPECIES: primosomal protein N' [Sporosarcina]GKV64244.1 primosomal protein N' [Sporosarcina sp. NCCP-2331]GLB54292.1 primosomal protein N' [Sporosarcina sp. NCCP-2378]